MSATVYYTYVSYENKGRLYIGSRKCPVDKTPDTDPYLGSYKDKTFQPIGKAILGVYGSKEEALEAEVELHRINDVAKNPLFANQACLTSKGFSHGMLGKKHSQKTRERLSKALSGENATMKGKTHTLEARKKMSKAKSGANNPRYRLIDWYHPVFGEVLQKSCSDMVKMFPEQELDEGCLSKVSRGILPYHKGWRTLENKNSIDILKRRWYHKDYGTFFASPTELARMFPEQNLSNKCLSRVSKGTRPHHRGWSLLFLV
jgi:hypothetical protein